MYFGGVSEELQSVPQGFHIASGSCHGDYRDVSEDFECV